MTMNVAALPDGGAAPPALRAAQLPVPSAAGVNDPAALARQQLPNAVPAPSLIAHYNAPLPVPVPKPILRTVSTHASSALAAQFIAQEPGLGEEDLAIFESRTQQPPFTPEEEAAVESFVAPRIERSDAQGDAPIKAAVAKAQTAVVEKDVEQKAVQTMQASAVQNRGISQLAASLPPMLTLIVKSPTLAQARGIGAYQLAGTRNATIKREPESAAQPQTEVEAAL